MLAIKFKISMFVSTKARGAANCLTVVAEIIPEHLIRIIPA